MCDFNRVACRSALLGGSALAVLPFLGACGIDHREPDLLESGPGHDTGAPDIHAVPANDPALALQGGAGERLAPDGGGSPMARDSGPQTTQDRPARDADADVDAGSRQAPLVEDPCAPNPCSNGGRCIAQAAAYECDCATLAFAGARCELPRFEALALPTALGSFAIPVALGTDGGMVIGTTSDGAALLGSFRWTVKDGFTDLTPVMGTAASGMSEDGSVLLGVESHANGPSFVWSEAWGKLDLPAPAGLPNCPAAALDRTGTHITGTCYDTARSAWNAVRWVVEGGAVRVDVLPNSLGGTQSEGRAINSDGTKIAGTSFAAGGYAMLWTLSETELPRGEDIGLLPNPGRYPTARALSADGLVIAGDDGTNAFSWSAATGIRPLSQPVPIDSNSDAFVIDLDAAGSVVVGGLLPATSGTAFETLVWDVNGAHRLRELLVDAGVAPSALQAWTLTNPAAVSADGSTLVGMGIDPGGKRQGWIARLR